MSRLSVVSVLMTGVLAGACGVEAQDEVAVRTAELSVQTTYVVNFAGNRVPARAASMVGAAGGRLVSTLAPVGIGLVTASDPGFATKMARQSGVESVGSLQRRALPEVQQLEPYAAGPSDQHALAPDEAFEPFQWDMRRIGADRAWAVTSGSHDTVVAVIDTGVAWNHPDLAPNVLAASCYSIAALVGAGPCSAYPDVHWHGTHVAGTVAGAFDEGVIIGVGPNLGIASYNVFELFDNGGGNFDYGAADYPIWLALVDAADRGYPVANLSLGGTLALSDGRGAAAAWTSWLRVLQYVNNRGLTVVAAAGNEAARSMGAGAFIPADLPSVVTVSATGIRPLPEFPQDGAFDVLTFYSNSGNAIDLAAPGGDLGPDGTEFPFPAAYHLILSADVYPEPGCAATASCPIDWAWAAGTSMAAPHVAGVAGLIADRFPGIPESDRRARLLDTAEPLAPRLSYGRGMVNAAAAVGAD